MLAFDMDFFVRIVVHGWISTTVHACSHFLFHLAFILSISLVSFSPSLSFSTFTTHFLAINTSFRLFHSKKKYGDAKIFDVCLWSHHHHEIKTKKMYTKRDRWWTKAEWGRKKGKKKLHFVSIWIQHLMHFKCIFHPQPGVFRRRGKFMHTTLHNE